ncbi:MAG: cyclic nucleotide-binding domain-containing protein [Hyphomicrobiales bacterium]
MSSLADEVDLLRRIPLFAQIDPSKLKLLAFTSERIAFEADQVLFKQGDEGDAAYVIMEGEADVIIDTPAGEIVLATVGRNDFVGEIAILCDVPRTATIRAKSALDTLKVSKEHFIRLISEFPEMGIEVMRELADRLVKTSADLAASREKLRQAGA